MNEPGRVLTIGRVGSLAAMYGRVEADRILREQSSTARTRNRATRPHRPTQNRTLMEPMDHFPMTDDEIAEYVAVLTGHANAQLTSIESIQALNEILGLRTKLAEIEADYVACGANAATWRQRAERFEAELRNLTAETPS